MAFKVSASRSGGERRTATVTPPKVAAKRAKSLARRGWTVIVSSQSASTAGAKMICNPIRRGRKIVASCDISPRFRQLLRSGR